MHTLAKDVVVNILCRKSVIWNNLRQKSLAVNDHGLYTRTIQQAASLVCMFYNQDSLYKRGCRRTSYKQMDALHEEVVALGGEGCSVYELGKLIVQLMPDKEKYSFVTEDDLTKMLRYYPRKIPTCLLAHHGPEINETQVFNDITKVVREMEQSSLTELEVDEHTHLLMILLKEESQEEICELEYAAMKRVKPDAMDQLDKGDHIFLCISNVLGGVICHMRLMLQGHLSTLRRPLFDLYNPRNLNISIEILDIVDVVEIRRMALGSRFISRSHLIWAFYELGYGLPPKIRNAIKFTSNDEDFPPYQIYVDAMKLAEYCGGSSMQLEHFVYAVIFSNGIGFEATLSDEMVQDFYDFIADVDLESSGEWANLDQT